MNLQNYQHKTLCGLKGKWSAVQQSWDENGEFILMRKDGCNAKGGLVFHVDCGAFTYVCAAHGDLDAALNEHYSNGNKATKTIPDDKAQALGELDSAFRAMLSGMDRLTDDVPGLASCRNKLSNVYASFTTCACSWAEDWI